MSVATKFMDEAVGSKGLADRVCAGRLDAVLIAGPTASGKSALAIAIAEKLDGVIVNADSMQTYADLRLLSARPTAEDEARLPHRLYGFVPASREYSVGDYLKDAGEVMAKIRAAGRLAVVVGGTGLYFRALTEGLVQTPPVSAELRAHWLRAHHMGEDIHAALAARDTEAATRLNPADYPRILRALEVFDATGAPLSQWQRQAQSLPLLPTGRWAGLFLSPPRDALVARIDSRFLTMVQQGALDEVRHLAALALPENRGVMKAHGVPHLLAHLAGRIDLQEVVLRGQKDTRRYARRQLTWARKFMADWLWLSSGDAAKALL